MSKLTRFQKRVMAVMQTYVGSYPPRSREIADLMGANETRVSYAMNKVDEVLRQEAAERAAKK